MPRGFTLTELAVAVTMVALLLAVGLPRLSGVLDWVAADRAAREVTTALAVARAAPVSRSPRTRCGSIAGKGPTGGRTSDGRARSPRV